MQIEREMGTGYYMNKVENSRERVRLAIKHNKIDKLPKGELVLDDAAIGKFLAVQNVGFDERLDFIEQLGLDLISLSPVKSYPINKLPCKTDLAWPDLEKWVNQTSLFTFAIIDGAFEVGMRTLGFMDFLKLPRTSPLSLRDFIDAVEKLNIEAIKELTHRGLDGIILADDIAYNKSLLINPITLREYFFPSLARQVEAAHRLNLTVFFHSDGNYRDILSDLMNMGFQGLHCLDRNSGMALSDVRLLVGDKLCLWGHLDVEDVNKANDPYHLENLIAPIRQLNQQKGFILGTTSGIFEGMDLTALKNIYQSV